MKKIITGTFIVVVLAVGVFLGVSHFKTKAFELNDSEIMTLLAEHEETMKIKMQAGEMTFDEMEYSIKEYQDLLGVCDNNGTPQKGKQQFEDLTEEKVFELIELKTYYLNELVIKGEITEEEAALKLTKYSEMLNSRLDGTFVKGSGLQKGKNALEKIGKMLGKGNKYKGSRGNNNNKSK